MSENEVERDIDIVSEGSFLNGLTRDYVPFFTSGTRVVAVEGDYPLGTEKSLVAFRQNPLHDSYGTINSTLLSSDFATGSEGLYKINFYRFPGGTLTGSWSDVNNSLLQYDETTNFDSHITGNPLLSINLSVTPILGSGGTSGTNSIDYTKLKMVMKDTDEFLITKESVIEGGGNDTTLWSIIGAELF